MKFLEVDKVINRLKNNCGEIFKPLGNIFRCNIYIIKNFYFINQFIFFTTNYHSKQMSNEDQEMIQDPPQSNDNGYRADQFAITEELLRRKIG